MYICIQNLQLHLEPQPLRDLLAWSRAGPSVARARAAVASTRSDHQGHVVLCLLCVVFRVPRSCACFVLCMIGHLTLEVRHRQGVVYRQHVVGNARPDGNLLSSRAQHGPQGVSGNLLSSWAQTAHKLVWLSNMMCIYGSMRHWSDRWLDSVVFFSSSSSSSSLERESS